MQTLDFVVQILLEEQPGQPGLTGSGIIVAPDRVLTCEHVTARYDWDGESYRKFRDYAPTQLKIRPGSAEPINVTAIERHSQKDLALLHLAQPLAVAPAHFLKDLSRELIPQLEQKALSAYGYPAAEGGAQQYHKAVAPPLKPEFLGDQITELQPEGGVKEGSSGGPLVIFVDEQPVCIGINYLGGKEVDHSRTIAADVVLEFLALQGIQPPVRAARDLIPKALNPDQRPRRWMPESPYKRLDAFTESDRERFFGRTEEVAKFVSEFSKLLYSNDDTEVTRILPVVGPSGVGKSSLLQAGLLPVLRGNQTYQLNPDREQQWLWPDGASVTIQNFRPGNRPLETLARELARLDPGTQTLGKKTDDQLTLLRDKGDEGLRFIADSLLPGDGSQYLLLVIDQFEEAYTALPTTPDPTDQSEEAEKARKALADHALFIANLLCAACDANLRLAIIIGLRSDFLTAMHRYDTGLYNLIADKEKFLISGLREEGLRQAIALPATQAGYPLPDDTVSRLVEQALGREGVLPLLQVTLDEIWRGMAEHKEPNQVLAEKGGLIGVLERSAEQVYQGLNTQAQRIAERMFLSLTQLGEGVSDTRRRTAVSELIAHGETEREVSRVLDAFANRDVRLITLSDGVDSNGAPEKQAEITHEALFQHWDRLRTWLDEGRKDERFKRQLSDAANGWQDQGRKSGSLWQQPNLGLLRDFASRREQDMTARQRNFYHASLRRERSGRWLRIGLFATFAILSIGLGYSAWQANLAQQDAKNQAEQAEQARAAAVLEQQKAEQERQAAEQAQKTAEQQRQRAEQAEQSAQRDRDRAIESEQTAERQKTLAEQERDRAEKERQAAETERNRALVAERLAEQQRELAEEQQQIAVSQRERAEAQFQQLAGIANNFIFDFHDSIANLAGSTAARQKIAREGRRILQLLAKEAEDNPSVMRNLAVSYFRFGDIQTVLGDAEAALENYQQGIDLFSRISEADPSSASAQRDLSVSYSKIGDIQAAQGNTAAALESYQQSLAIDKALAEADPSSASAQRDLSVSYERIGTIQAAQGNTAAALESYQQSLAIRVARAEADPSSASAQHDLSVSYSKIGDIQAAQGNTAAALESYQQSLAIDKALAEADPSSASAQRDLSVSYERIGTIQAAQGNTAAALESYQQSLAIRVALAEADPSSASAQRDLAISHEKLGDIKMKLNDSKIAFEHYKKSLDITFVLAENDPNSAHAQRTVAVSLAKMGVYFERVDDSARAMEFYQQTKRIIESLARRDSSNQQYQNDLAWVQNRIRIVSAVEPESEKSAESQLNPEVVRLIEQMTDSALTGEIDQAIVAFEQALALEPALEGSSVIYNRLCWFGSLSGQAQQVLVYCDKAVELAPDDGGIKDSRGVARALTGDYAGAIDDFQAYLIWVQGQEQAPEAIFKRASWVQSLKAGENPLTPEVLQGLRSE